MALSPRGIAGTQAREYTTRLLPGTIRRSPGGCICYATRNSTAHHERGDGAQRGRAVLISVCVPSIRGHVIRHLVDSIIGQTYTNWELIIGAQGNDPELLGACAAAQSRDARIRVAHIAEFGRSRGMNRAAAEARGEILAFTDDDCEAAPDWLATVAACFEQEPAVGIVGGDVVAPAARPFRISTCPAVHTIERIYRPAESGYTAPPGFYWCGGNLAVRRSVMEALGGFDEYLGAGTEFPVAEDVDFALRAEQAGTVMWTTPRSIIYHTYGRRYGLRSALAHQINYAVGRGAFGAKVYLWGHRLRERWTKPQTLAGRVCRFARNPRRFLVRAALGKYSRQGYTRYLAEYELGPKLLSRRKSH